MSESVNSFISSSSVLSKINGVGYSSNQSSNTSKSIDVQNQSLSKNETSSLDSIKKHNKQPDASQTNAKLPTDQVNLDSFNTETKEPPTVKTNQKIDVESNQAKGTVDVKEGGWLKDQMKEYAKNKMKEQLSDSFSNSDQSPPSQKIESREIKAQKSKKTQSPPSKDIDFQSPSPSIPKPSAPKMSMKMPKPFIPKFRF